MPLRIERLYEVINKDYFLKDFKVSLKEHRYSDIRQLLSSLMFLHVMRIKRTILKIAVIEKLIIFLAK